MEPIKDAKDNNDACEAATEPLRPLEKKTESFLGEIRPKWKFGLGTTGGQPLRHTDDEDGRVEIASVKNTASSACAAFPSESKPFPDDSWLDHWDLTIHRCPACQLPFRSAKRLKKHQLYNCLLVATESAIVGSESSAPFVRIDEDGDLEIQVGPNESSIIKRFLVASQVLRCQSRAFYASFCESYAFKGSADIRRAHLRRPSKPAVIFLDDDSDALELILMVLHHRYLKIPKNIEFKVLVEVAAICEKYMLHVPLTPMVGIWAERWKEKALEEGYEDWILVAWVFGISEIFTKVSKHIALKLTTTSTQRWLRSDGTKLHPVLPELITDKLYKQRNLVLSLIREKFEAIQAQRMYKYSKAEKSKLESQALAPTICTHHDEAQSCDWIQLGHMMETTERHMLDTDLFWNQPISRIANFFTSLLPEHEPEHIQIRYNDGGFIDYLPGNQRNRKNAMLQAICPCGWVTEMHQVCKSLYLEGNKSVISGIDLCDFRSRVDIWGKTGGSEEIRSRV